MPHCVIEYAQELENHIEALINAAHQGLLASGLFKEEDIKIRATSFKHYKKGSSSIGDTKNIFAHFRIHILSGRTAEQKSHLSQAVFSEVAATSSQLQNISIEIVDIDRSSYIKS